MASKLSPFSLISPLLHNFPFSSTLKTEKKKKQWRYCESHKIHVLVLSRDLTCWNFAGREVQTSAAKWTREIERSDRLGHGCENSYPFA